MNEWKYFNYIITSAINAIEIDIRAQFCCGDKENETEWFIIETLLDWMIWKYYHRRGKTHLRPGTQSAPISSHREFTNEMYKNILKDKRNGLNFSII